MKKVAYAVKRVTREGGVKKSGVGYLTETDLITAQMSKNGKPYIHVFKDCVKSCAPVPLKEDEYAGTYFEILEIEIEKTNPSGQNVGKEKLEIVANYNIWFKFID